MLPAKSNKCTMAKRKLNQKKQMKRNETGEASNRRGLILTVGVGLLILGLLTFSAYQVLVIETGQSTTELAIPADGDGLEKTSLEAGRNQQAEGVDAEPVTDRETRYLGPATDPATLALAEAGELGQPALVFFHADW